jgi:hypothetical protein
MAHAEPAGHSWSDRQSWNWSGVHALWHDKLSVVPGPDPQQASPEGQSAWLAQPTWNALRHAAGAVQVPWIPVKQQICWGGHSILRKGLQFAPLASSPPLAPSFRPLEPLSEVAPPPSGVPPLPEDGLQPTAIAIASAVDAESNGRFMLLTPRNDGPP